MLQIEPTVSTNFRTNTQKVLKVSEDNNVNKNKKNKSLLAGTLAGLATLGAVAIGFKKTSPTSYEEALKKAGVMIKDNIAILTETGEKFTGKIQRFEKRNRKETVEFIDGLMTEKIYHSLLGKELNGEFYKNGEMVLRIWKSVGQKKNSSGFAYSGKGIHNYEFGPYIETKEGFAWARDYIKKHYS